MKKSTRQLVPPFDPELIGDGEYITLSQFFKELYKSLRGIKTPVVHKSEDRP